MKKEFDCVESKHRAALELQRRLARMDREGQLAFWRKETQALKARKALLTRKKQSGVGNPTKARS